MKKIIFTVLLLTFVAINSDARPQYSILQTYGTKCNTCHQNNQGGALRSAPGFLSRKDMAVIKPVWIGLDGVFDKLSTSSFLDDMVLVGMDTRIQSARWKVPGKTERDWMFMVGTPYISIKPFDWIEIEGYYNIAMDVSEMPVYPGQSQYGASAIFKINDKLPTLRVGLFQPTIVQKWDDHTMLIRQVPALKGRTPLIPADYAELGAQLDYEAFDWFGVSAGLFKATNLASTVQLPYRTTTIGNNRIDYNFDKKKPIVDSNSYSTMLRATINPELPFGFVGYCGGTFLLNRNYYVANAFLGVGMNDTWSLITEWTQSYKEDSRLTNGILVDLTYQVTEAILPFIRYERAIVRETPLDGAGFITVNQYVIGAHINLLPFIDVLPEYRIYDTEAITGDARQWAIQVHIFY